MSQRCGRTPKGDGSTGMQCSGLVCGSLFAHIKKRKSTAAKGKRATAKAGSRKNTSGGGGLFRAYLRKRSVERKAAGTAGGVHFKSNESESYRGLTTAQKRELAPMAEAMTIAWRQQRHQPRCRNSKKQVADRARNQQAWQSLLFQQRAARLALDDGASDARPASDEGQAVEVRANSLVRGGLLSWDASPVNTSTESVAAVAKNTRQARRASNAVEWGGGRSFLRCHLVVYRARPGCRRPHVASWWFAHRRRVCVCKSCTCSPERYFFPISP